MIAKTDRDTCYSRYGLFATPGAIRSEIDPAEGRSAFDFTIVKAPSYNDRGEVLDGHFHLERQSDGAFIPSNGLGNTFKPLQHMDVYDIIVNEIMPQVPGMKLETVGTMYGLGTGIVTATMGEDFYLNGDKSPNRMRLMFFNPCGRGSVLLGFTNVRVFCQNCITAAKRDIRNRGGVLIRHTSAALFSAKDALANIALEIEAAREIKARSERLASIPITRERFLRVLDRIYPVGGDMSAPKLAYNQAARAEVEFQFDAGPTHQTISEYNGWKLLNSFTYPVFNPDKKSRSSDAVDVNINGQIHSRAERVARIFEAVEGELTAA